MIDHILLYTVYILYIYIDVSILYCIYGDPPELAPNGRETNVARCGPGVAAAAPSGPGPPSPIGVVLEPGGSVMGVLPTTKT